MCEVLKNIHLGPQQRITSNANLNHKIFKKKAKITIGGSRLYRRKKM